MSSHTKQLSPSASSTNHKQIKAVSPPQSPNRHAKCIAQFNASRQDQKKWIKNIRSEYLNKRNNIKPIFERANDILMRRSYREKVQHGKKERIMEEQNRSNIHHKESKSSSTTPRSRRIRTEIPSFSPNFVKEIGNRKYHQIEDEIKQIQETRARYNDTKEPVDSQLAAELREFSPTRLWDPLAVHARYLPPPPGYYEHMMHSHLLDEQSHLLTGRYPLYPPPPIDIPPSNFATPRLSPNPRSAHPPHFSHSLYSPHFSPVRDEPFFESPRAKAKEPGVFRAATSRKDSPSPKHKQPDRNVRRILEQHKTEILEFLSGLLARAQ